MNSTILHSFMLMALNAFEINGSNHTSYELQFESSNFAAGSNRFPARWL